MTEPMDTLPARMTWAEMVEKYPDRWVVIQNPEMKVTMKGSSIASGDVLAVKTDDEICAYEDELAEKHLLKNMVFFRTTEHSADNEFFSGIVNVKFLDDDDDVEGAGNGD